MTTAHVPSDDRAIAAAHARLPEIAAARLRAVCEDLIGNPSSPWLVEQVEIAALAVHHQGIADLRERANRHRGVEAWEDGPQRQPEGAPAAAEPSGGPTDRPEARGHSLGAVGALSEGWP